MNAQANYGETIRFYLIDVSQIVTTESREQFGEKQLEQLADYIIKTGCLLRPLLVSKINEESYQLLSDPFEYYAAVLAVQKDTKRVLNGMVSAFLVKEDFEDAACFQLRLLK